MRGVLGRAGVPGLLWVTPLPSLQERQRLETILSLCAEYAPGDGGVGLEQQAFPGASGGRRPAKGSLGQGGAAAQPLCPQRSEEEERQQEESSSTESTGQEVRRGEAWSRGGVPLPSSASGEPLTWGRGDP